MTKQELLEKYKDYIKGIYLYPDKNIKVWFANNKQRIFTTEQDLEDYIKEHGEEML